MEIQRKGMKRKLIGVTKVLRKMQNYLDAAVMEASTAWLFTKGRKPQRSAYVSVYPCLTGPLLDVTLAPQAMQFAGVASGTIHSYCLFCKCSKSST